MRKLREEDRQSIMRYIGKEPEFNLFLIGDLENFGVDSEHVNFYAEDRADEYDFLIMRYRDSFVLYSCFEDYDADAAATYLLSQHAEFINGKGSVLERIVSYFPELNVKRSYLSKLTSLNQDSELPQGYECKFLEPNDARSQVDLFLLIEEFRDSYLGRESEQIENIKVNLESTGRAIGAYHAQALIGTAGIAASNSMSAMIIGVATHPDYRNLGIASALVASLCRDCLDRGMKFLCLFYDNPKAGSIYRKIGFCEMGGYILMTPNHENKDS